MESSEQPLVSVIMPAYNHEKYIIRGITSVLEQTYPHIEFIVIDDGSSDGTWNEILRTRESANIPFKALRQSNQGICKTLNRAIQESSGDLITAIASDDYFLPTKIERQVEVFTKADSRVALVHTSAFLDYQNGSELEDITGSYEAARESCFEQLLTQDVRIVTPSIMFRRTAFEAIGGFDESLETEDVDFFVRLAAEGFEFGYIPEALVVKTVVDQSAGTNMGKLFDVHERILEKHKHRITEKRYAELRSLMYQHLIKIAAGAGDFRLGGKTAIRLALESTNPMPLLKYAVWSARSAMLRELPPDTRHSLRLLRLRLRRKFVSLMDKHEK